MPFVVRPPIRGLTLVVPVTPRKGASIPDLLKEASAGMIRKIEVASAPSFLPFAERAGSSDGNFFVETVYVRRNATDNGYAARVVNVHLPESAKFDFRFEAGQGVADLLHAPVRVQIGEAFLTSFGRDILFKPGDSPEVAESLFLYDLLFRQTYDSFFVGPVRETHQIALATQENRFNRLYVYGDPQKPCNPRPPRPGCLPGIPAPETDEYD